MKPAAFLGLFIILACLTAENARSQIIYAGILGNRKYVVGAENPPIGVYVSPDAEQWAHICWTNCRVFDVFVVPNTQGQVIYVAGGNGVLKTVNGGLHWKIVTDWKITEVQAIQAEAPSGRRVVIGTAYGIYVSEDGGDTWLEGNKGLEETFVSGLQMDRYHTRRIWAGTEGGLYRSLDGGLSWETTGLKGVAVRCVIQHPNDSDRLLAGTENRGVYRSEDGGLIWETCGRWPDSLTVYDLAFDPGRNEVIYAGTHGNGVYRSTNGGMSWKSYGRLTHPVVHAVAVHPSGFVLAGTVGGGIFINHKGRTWEHAGLEGAQVWSLFIDQEVRHD
ncbi:MAG TPA: hypothetical protein ENN03_04475 [bacterium]|nr:hypothetical protein [bacterium]